MTASRRVYVLFLAAAAAPSGCERPPPSSTAEPAKPAAASRFDPATAGTVRGRVVWAGDVPTPPALPAAVPVGAGYRWTDVPEPFAPAVDPTTRGLAGAVVSLRGVDTAAARPWDLPPVRVELRDLRIVVHQGDGPPGRVGLVRAGDEVEAASRDAVRHSLRLRGAAFATLPLPDPDRPMKRRLDRPGLVELTSGSGYYWAAADLVVCDHPYHAVTGPDGRFTLTGVPAGRYELTAWVRDWHQVGKERDPETGLTFRRTMAPPLERATPVRVAAGGTVEQDFLVTAGEFGGSP